MLKLAVFTVMTPDYSVEETAPLLVETGYQGVEWRVTTVSIAPMNPNDPRAFWGSNRSTVDVTKVIEEAPRVRDLSKKAGLEICNLAAYEPATNLERIETIMRAAQVMGAPSLRVGIPRYDRSRPYPELLQEARRNLEPVQQLARQYGIKGLIEIHMGTIAPSASAACRILEGFDPQYLGAIFDPGNMINEGYENWRMGMEALGPYLGHVHAKNYRWVVSGINDTGTTIWQPEPAPMNEGQADWGQIIADLKAVGYDGFISFEDFSSQPTKDKLLRNAEYFRKLLA